MSKCIVKIIYLEKSKHPINCKQREYKKKMYRNRTNSKGNASDNICEKPVPKKIYM